MLSTVSYVCLGVCAGMWVISGGIYLGLVVLSFISVLPFQRSGHYWAACAPSHKMGFRSSVSKSGLPGEGRHEGLVPRNDVLTDGFI